MLAARGVRQERHYAQNIVIRCNGNKTRAADMLGVRGRTLYRLSKWPKWHFQYAFRRFKKMLLSKGVR